MINRQTGAPAVRRPHLAVLERRRCDAMTAAVRPRADPDVRLGAWKHIAAPRSRAAQPDVHTHLSCHEDVVVQVRLEEEHELRHQVARRPSVEDTVHCFELLAMERHIGCPLRDFVVPADNMQFRPPRTNPHPRMNQQSSMTCSKAGRTAEGTKRKQSVR
jgi:hypothetical protein